MMFSILFRCGLLALVEGAAVIFIFICLWQGKASTALVAVLVASLLGALIGPSHDDRAALAAFLKQQSG